ncbi:MAG: phosphoribosyltransferase family protein [Acidimicrobiia bacterium]|nr:phosphoribosyltransferase family protein [Acidimicrobiia bacterium]MDX2467036.1 phosphoribosyltransferase family protein [Acidimicrobiia bacterium]
MRYVDRADAGRQLAADVAAALPPADRSRTLVLGVPRGGVVVASEIATRLALELDVVLARKIGAPHNPELAIGAVGEDGSPILDRRLMTRLGVSEDYLESTVAAELRELQRRMRRYRGSRPSPLIEGRAVIVVDDGVATGATLRATLETTRRQNPAWLACAIPVGAPDSVARIARDVDAMVCPLQPRSFRAVGEWYESFTQTTDAEVMAALQGRGEGRDNL